MNQSSMRATHPYAGIAGRWLENTKGEVRSFEEAAKFLGDQDSRIIGSNTMIVRKGEAIAVRLYDTDIVTYYPDDTFEASNGGFRTPTTSNRLNQFGPRGWNFSHEKKKLIAWRHGKKHVCPCRLPVYSIHELRNEATR